MKSDAITVEAYLAGATRALEVDDGVATMIAGWAPDEIRWLTDMRTDDASAQRWERDDVDRWRPVV